jgi:hypothetical protein
MPKTSHLPSSKLHFSTKTSLIYTREYPINNNTVSTTIATLQVMLDTSHLYSSSPIIQLVASPISLFCWVFLTPPPRIPRFSSFNPHSLTTILQVTQLRNLEVRIPAFFSLLLASEAHPSHLAEINIMAITKASLRQWLVLSNSYADQFIDQGSFCVRFAVSVSL